MFGAMSIFNCGNSKTKLCLSSYLLAQRDQISLIISFLETLKPICDAIYLDWVVFEKQNAIAINKKRIFKIPKYESMGHKQMGKGNERYGKMFKHGECNDVY